MLSLVDFNNRHAKVITHVAASSSVLLGFHSSFTSVYVIQWLNDGKPVFHRGNILVFM